MGAIGPHISKDQLTLSQPGGYILPIILLLVPPGFSGLPTVLLSKRAELIGKIEFDDEPNRTAKVT